MAAEHNAAATKPIEPKVNELIGSRKSIILATVDAEGNPTSSYAPFARSGINSIFLFRLWLVIRRI